MNTSKTRQIVGVVVVLLAIWAIARHFDSSKAGTSTSTQSAATSTQSQPAPTQTPPVAQAASCTVDNVTINQFKPTYDQRLQSARVTGTLTHTCPYPVGVEIRWTSYGKDGSVAFTRSFWPNSISNIRPNEEMPFDFTESTSERPERSTVVVQSVRAWQARR
ncbi:hypothetical protein [Paraburkholderia susongensis]|uniref:Uncharacterized protein n=1 Tax=Paraburkholderia susongensis TaxID=1515439 RepID=A0A1X7I408_9BURK|nr:hypothetical protein [Paraburkholderia susongensis]SMG09134.1 hypothetical protein SAMN06265784_101308 [Paraburkholderia susongensis]